MKSLSRAGMLEVAHGCGRGPSAAAGKLRLRVVARL